MTLDQIPALVDQIVTTEIGTASLKDKAEQDRQILASKDQDLKPGESVRQRDLLLYQRLTGSDPRVLASSLAGMNLLHAALLTLAKQRAVTAVDNHVRRLGAKAPNFDKLKGLLTLVISYLLVGKNEKNVMAYSKIIAPLMARTNFYALFGLLGQHEKDLFTESFVLDAAGLSGTGQTQIFVAGFKRKDGVIDHGPTRSAWINSIREGSPSQFFGSTWPVKADLLSQGSGSTAAANSTSLGAMDAPDRRATGERDLAVLELRRLPQEIPVDEWDPMARQVFKLILKVRGL